MKRLICILLVIGLMMGLGRMASAAVTANSIVTAQTPNNAKQNFVQGTDVANTFKTVYTAGANGSKCNAIQYANDDASATHIMILEVVNGGVSYPICQMTTTSPGAASQTSYNTVSAISATNCPGLPVDSDGNPYLQMVSGDVLKATFETALTASDQIIVLAQCADF